jgi:hypothetical protein
MWDQKAEEMAKELGLQPGGNAVEAILEFCEAKIKEYVADMDACNSHSDMLGWVASKVGTTFRVLRTDEDLRAVKQEFIDKGERAFANIESDLTNDVYGITYRLQNRQRRLGIQFVSIIDSRGAKAPRSYFTKWHEIAHLLTLTRKTQVVFRRTHSLTREYDPEEQLMDIIAGKFGFYTGVTYRFIEREISFREVERLRKRLCPEASQISALINFVKYWPTPCIHMMAEMAWTKSESNKIKSGWNDPSKPPEQSLRVTRATPNIQARKHGFMIYDGMRVPEGSVISKVFYEGLDFASGHEELSWGSGFPARTVWVEARHASGVVEALIRPAESALTATLF